MPRVSPAKAELKIDLTWELGDWIRALAWGPDGASLFAACADGRVVTVATNSRSAGTEQPQTVHEHPGGALTVAVSQAGVLASGGQDGRLVVADKADDLGGWVEYLAWRPDGDRLAAAAGREVYLRQADGRPIATSTPMQATVACIGWHPRGTSLAVGSYGGVRLLAGGDGRESDRLDWIGSVLTLAFSPDGRRLAHGNQDASVHFWDLRKKRELEMTGYALKVRQLAWSQDGRWLATGGGAAVTVWDFSGRGPAGTRPRELERHEDRLTALAFQPCGSLLASAAEDGLVLLWNVGNDDLPLAAVAFDAGISCLQWSPDGSSIAVGTATGILAVLNCSAEAGEEGSRRRRLMKA